MSKQRAIEEVGSQTDAPSAKFALWALGFRPFYLLASIFAMASIPLWVEQYADILHAPVDAIAVIAIVAAQRPR
ncbi:MAG: NnrS family protein [Betaproteobacteria bacterium]